MCGGLPHPQRSPIFSGRKKQPAGENKAKDGVRASLMCSLSCWIPLILKLRILASTTQTSTDCVDSASCWKDPSVLHGRINLTVELGNGYIDITHRASLTPEAQQLVCWTNMPSAWQLSLSEPHFFFFPPAGTTAAQPLVQGRDGGSLARGG